MKRLISPRWLLVGLELLLALSLSTSLILADNGGFAPITWWTADGGGGESAGGGYRFSGTAGQPDAGAMAGGIYRLDGGFWEGGETAPVGGGPDVYLPFVTQQRLEERPFPRPDAGIN